MVCDRKGLRGWIQRRSKTIHRLPPPVAISAIISNGKQYPGANGLTLPPHTENLEIDYAALSLAIPGVLFRYKLEGVDGDWQNVGTRRQAFYTKLHPGRYKFRVMACNNDGVWSKEAQGWISPFLLPGSKRRGSLFSASPPAAGWCR